MGKEISKNGLPSAISPLTFVFTGNGRASQGAQEMFRALPHEFVKPSELPELTRSWYSSHKNDSLRFKVYGCVVEEQDMVARRHDADERKKEHGDSTPVASSSWHNNVFDSKEYHFHPELYVPTFHERIAPYTNVLINATYWDRRYPRLLTFKQSEALLNEQRKQREAATASGKPGVHGLLAVSDISCDLDGSVQFLTRLSSIEKPFFVYDIFKRHAHEGVDGEGVLMMAINQLASEMPKEATRSFGSALLNFAADLANSDATQPLASSNLPVSLAGACITNQGQLTPTYSYIEVFI